MAAAGSPIRDDELIDHILTGLGSAYNSTAASLGVSNAPMPYSSFYSLVLSFEALQAQQSAVHERYDGNDQVQVANGAGDMALCYPQVPVATPPPPDVPDVHAQDMHVTPPDAGAAASPDGETADAAGSPPSPGASPGLPPSPGPIQPPVVPRPVSPLTEVSSAATPLDEPSSPSSSSTGDAAPGHAMVTRHRDHTRKEKSYTDGMVRYDSRRRAFFVAPVSHRDASGEPAWRPAMSE
nr:cellulose-complementing protein-like [Aegilops tauschii subsp. strangulata]